MSNLTYEQIDNILALAAKATPGPWYRLPEDDQWFAGVDQEPSVGGEAVVWASNKKDEPETGFKRDDDAAYVAALDPQTVTAILSELAAAREALEPFALAARNIPPDKQDKDVTRVVMDEILSADELKRMDAIGARLRSPHAELLITLDGLRVKHFRRASDILHATPKAATS